MCKLMKKMMTVSLVMTLLVCTAGMPAQVAAKAKWKTVYARYLKTIENLEKRYPDGTFLYLNSDNIPELFLWGNCNAAGCRLLTIYKNKVYDYALEWSAGFSYLKKRNRFSLSMGRDEAFCTYVAKFSKGEMVGLGGGVFGSDVFHNGNVKCDKEGRPILKYYWNAKRRKGADLEQYYYNAKNGKKVTRKEYYNRINRLLGADREKYRNMPFSKTIQQIKKKLKM